VLVLICGMLAMSARAHSVRNWSTLGGRGDGDHKCHHLAFGCLSSPSYGLLVDVRVMCSGADVQVSVSSVVVSPRSFALVTTICSV
jgi:hypothetical protein